MNFLRNKKGDLSLSVNAIVILVIAIIFLGLAITFSKGLLAKGQSKIQTGIENVDISQPADAENNLRISAPSDVKVGEPLTLKISVYNTQGSEVTLEPSLASCKNSTATLGTFSLQSGSAKVSPYKEQRYTAILSSSENIAAATTIICSIDMNSTSGVYTSGQVVFKYIQ